MSMGERLYELRKQKQLSQEALASNLNVSRQALSKWELDESIPELDNLVTISRFFNVTLDYLVKGERGVQNAKIDKKSIQLEYVGITFALIGFVLMIGLSDDGSEIFYWPLQDQLIGLIMQILTVAILTINYINGQITNKAYTKFWCVALWCVSFFPLMWLIGAIPYALSFSEFLILYGIVNSLCISLILYFSKKK